MVVLFFRHHDHKALIFKFMFQEVQVDFEARNAEDPDHPGIKKLLQQVCFKPCLTWQINP